MLWYWKKLVGWGLIRIFGMVSSELLYSHVADCRGLCQEKFYGALGWVEQEEEEVDQTGVAGIERSNLMIEHKRRAAHQPGPGRKIFHCGSSEYVAFKLKETLQFW
jgi:hypothetical protein